MPVSSSYYTSGTLPLLVPRQDIYVRIRWVSLASWHCVTVLDMICWAQYYIFCPTRFAVLSGCFMD